MLTIIPARFKYHNLKSISCFMVITQIYILKQPSMSSMFNKQTKRRIPAWPSGSSAWLSGYSTSA